MSSRSWSSAVLFPDNVELLCGEEARAFEGLRSDSLDLFFKHDFELVMPPLLERTEQWLRTPTDDLSSMMFSTQDPVTGEVLRVRADITAQTAFLDACCERYSAEKPARMCYALPALHARPRHILSTREPWYAGAELYGSPGLAADVEMLELAIACMRLALSDTLCVNLGHAAIFPALADAAKLSPEARDALLRATARKSAEDIRTALAAAKPGPHLDMLSALARLHGGPEVLEEARRLFATAPPAVLDAVESLFVATERIAKKIRGVELHVDLGDLAGFRYHTGLVFSVYAEACGEALAYGGRCDGVGACFGRSRPAVGFSADLRLLAATARGGS